MFTKTSQSNYEAWNLDVENFDISQTTLEKLAFLLRFAILAPSSHNSQPWFFSVNDNSIKVSLEPARLLPVGDSNNRQALISLGCATENIIIAADYYGYNSEVFYNDKPEIIIKLSQFTRKVGLDHLIFNIPKRMVNRSPYLDKKIDSSTIEKIKGLATDDLKIDIITDVVSKNSLADIALKATATAMADRCFREELSRYVISNTSKVKVGIPGFNMGFPTPLSYLAPSMLKFFDMSKLSNKADEKLLKEGTPHIVVISTKEDGPRNWVAVGRIFQHISLLTTAHGVSLAVWAAPIQIGDYYQDIQKILNTDFRPQMFFRMGYATKDMGGHSPRFLAGEVILK